MSTPTPEVTPLGANTLARKWRLDVNTGTKAAPVWVRLRGVQEFNPTEDPTTQDTTDYDSRGWSSSTNTLMGWGVEATVRRAVAEDGETYDPAQEFLRLKAPELGPENTADIRYYEYNGEGGPLVQAYRGDVSVAWSEQAGGADGLSTASVTLGGQGVRTPIAHPLAA